MRVVPATMCASMCASTSATTSTSTACRSRVFHSAACLVFLLCSVMRVAATDLRLRHVYHWGEPQSSSSRLGSPHLSRLGAHARDTNDGDTHARTLARRDLEAADTTMAMLQLADHLRARVRASHAATTRDTSQTSGATAATVESIVAEVLPSGSGSGDDDAGFSEEDASAIASADDYAPVLRVQTTTSTDDGTSAQRLVNIYEDQYTPLIRHSGSPPRDVHGNAADKILLPNLALRSTVLALALASSNAYTLPDRPDWMDMDHWGQKNVSFGWDADGLRGHVFASKDGDVLLVAFKGTTPFILGKGGPSSERDRLNDNVMFSCCCGKFSSAWANVCDCHRGTNALTRLQQCSAACVQDSLHFSSSYYNVARRVYNDLRMLYPLAQIWFTGHSLGGALASVMALTTGLPAVAFQAPGDRMYATRLGFRVAEGGGGNVNVAAPDSAAAAAAEASLKTLAATGPTALDRYNIFHIGNSADPVFIGKCTGPWSACYYGGYALEAKCHMSKKCVYEVPGSRLDIRYHRMTVLIERVILANDKVPACESVAKTKCMDCDDWEFV